MHSRGKRAGNGKRALEDERALLKLGLITDYIKVNTLHYNKRYLHTYSQSLAYLQLASIPNGFFVGIYNRRASWLPAKWFCTALHISSLHHTRQRLREGPAYKLGLDCARQLRSFLRSAATKTRMFCQELS